MKLLINYWDCGDTLVTRTITVPDVEAGIELLVNDPQHPLGQVDSIQILDEETSCP